MLLFAGKLAEALFNLCRQVGGALLRLNVSVVEIFNKFRHSSTPYLSDLLMIFKSSSSTSSVGIPSERSILRNSFIPLINRLHSKSVSFSLVFLLNIKMTSLYLVIPFYKEVCVLSNVWIVSCKSNEKNMRDSVLVIILIFKCRAYGIKNINLEFLLFHMG